MSELRWFCRSTQESNALTEKLKLTACPHCKAVGTLNRHGFLYAFSIWCADKIRRLGLTTACLWRFLQLAVAGSILPAIRAVGCHLSHRTLQRVWKKTLRLARSSSAARLSMPPARNSA